MRFLTTAQIAALQSAADHCFMQGYSSTQFARTIAYDASILGVDIPCVEGCDFYHTSQEPYMIAALNQLGYDVSLFGIKKLNPPVS